MLWRACRRLNRHSEVFAARLVYSHCQAMGGGENHSPYQIKEEVLSQIPKPERPSEMLCQAHRGCALNVASY
jgi:hypothetical protein